MRPIDADALKGSLIGNRYGVKAIDYAIDQAPTLDVRPVVHGHWIEKGTDEICSVCGMSFCEMPFTYDLGSGDYIRNYCPNCGNPMDLEGTCLKE